MSTRSQLTKDLNESVKLLLGKQVKILFKNVVRLETKGDKTENRVLVFSPCRILLLTAKVPTRIDCHFHYLEIQALESKRGNQLSLLINDKTYSFLAGDDSACSTEVDTMISALATAIRNIFPTVPLQYIIRKIDVIPSTRLQQLRDMEVLASGREVGPCGGFSTQYACMCDFHNMPYREEVAWDVDNIYVALNTRELCLKDFDHLEQKDLVPIISALEYNTWFTKLRANHVRLSHETMDRVLHVMRKSLSLEELYLDNLGLKADFTNKLTNVIKLNIATCLHTIDLSNNMIEDKGAINLTGCISRLNKGLVHLNLSHCGLTSKGVNQLAHTFTATNSIHTTLTYLNLSGNSLKDDINNLYNFLGQPNALRHLDLSSTDIILENLFGSLVRGCTINLVHLNVSRNPFSSKKSKESPLSFKQFFTNALNLKYLNMAHCKLPQEALKNLLLGLACNEYTKEMSLDLTSNSLGAQGAHVLESCVHGVRCISSLDISDNNMDMDLAGVIVAISKNKSLKHLSMGRNMANMKAKHVLTVMDAIVQIIQDEECVLQSLVIPDSRLKSDLHNFLNALGDNKCLEMIDISGNLIGDSGARLLAKALQINSKLRTIIYDRNNITLQGFHDIAYALESNRIVQYMPYPIYDVAPCMKASADRTEAVMRKIQDLLNRNAAPKRCANRGSMLVQPNFLLTAKQQTMGRLIVQTQEAIKNMAAESISSNNDINHATGVIQDANNSKHLLGRLQEVALQKEEPHPLDTKLQQIVCDIHSCINDHFQNTMEKMLKTCKELCPYVLRDNPVTQDIKKECRNKNQVPLDFLTAVVRQQAGTEITCKMREMCSQMASQMSEQVVDEVQDALLRSYKILVGDTSGLHLDSPPRRSRLSSSDSSRHGASDISITDSSHQSDHSPMATPHLSIKRKSLHGRKLRPKSVVDSVEGLSADDIPSLLPSNARNSEEEDSVTELPNATHQLQHLVKGRPRRTKTRAPTRPLLRPGEAVDTPDLGEGLDTFFRPGSVTPTSDDCSSFQAEGSPNHDFASPVLSEDRKTPKLSRNSPHLKGLLNPTPRSRSSDNLEKYSPLTARKSSSDVSSPLARRFTGEPLISRESSDGSIATETHIFMDHSSSPSSTLSKGMSPDSSKTDDTDSLTHSKPKAAPPIAPKPRPWSMVNSDPRSGDLSLLSDGSSPANSTGNTPDSGDALDSSESSSIDRRISKESKLKKSVFQSYLPDRGAFRFSQAKEETADNKAHNRDSNYNCSGAENAHIVSYLTMGKKRKSKGKKSTQPPQNSKAESTKNNEVEMNLENKEHKGSNLPPPDKKVMPPMPTTSSESKIEDANTKIQVLSDEASCTDYLVSKDGEESWDNRTQEEKKNKDHQPKQYQIKGEMRNKQSSKVTDEHDGRQSRRGWNAEKPDKDWFKEDANSNIQSSAAASHINDLAFQTGEECWHDQNMTKKNKDVNRRSNQYWAEGKTRDDKWHSSSNSVGDEKNSKQGGNSFKRNDRITHFSPNRNVDRVQDDEYNEYYGFAKKGRVQYIKVEEIESDLFAMPDEYALAHCVAEDMSMGSGIAVQFSQTFKGREQLFQQRQKQGGLAILEVKGRYIYYLVTKRLSNGKPTLYTLWCSLKKLQEHIKKFEVRKLAIPRIGCGLDRLDWSMVKPMIEYVFRDTNIQITVCNFQQEEEECRNEMQKKLPKSEPKCALRNVRYPVVDIEPECAIIYLGTEDGHVTDGMRRLDAKFHFLSEYTARRNKMGDVIQKWSFDRMYALYGFIVRTSANAELDFVALGNCISEMNRKNSKRDQFYYAGLEAFDDKDDNLLLTKVVNLLRHSLRKNVEVYVCWPNELQHLMPQTNSYY